MSILSGKNILLGVTGGIAAYKSTYLVRLFKKQGANVQVLMTPSSKDFVTPLTLSTLSNNPVLSDFFDPKDENKLWNNHVELALWADIFLIAPATSNTLSKMATARADNLLLATYLSSKCPVYFAPAMDLDMHKNLANQENIQKLVSHGKIHIPVSSGFLASGLEGDGRMKEPDEIINFIIKNIKKDLTLLNKKILITAGPTYEPIDAVRFIGNFSSGKMGFSLAKTAANLGAEVILITGPSSLNIIDDNISVINIVTADEMFFEVKKHFKSTDISILSAAVSDFKPKSRSKIKIKKLSKDLLSIDLVENIDILKHLGENKSNKQILVGFALETDNEFQNALSKIENKNLDAIVLNSLNDKGAGFGHDTNKITFINKNGKINKFKLKSKIDVSKDIFNELIKNFL
ncbi:MAG: bifunctional phosphopantothenoylcysteine decarboxylase/phosphopantothenate--cysteine ligase CoaBC [Flavobacteriaceae bacterium]|nr:bifunctional phosphopantothenoylcysteine decarboxylase/phosphopantothenate--cysteine ligase CoaBC [Flavobacteriaceae bacterium]MDG1031387.1 bifunctional phosphopantothenoylcysteine decarboxylase/phosphopantothenate--cysteine ligase CoaBC [Flavobacteriaceae bacterium]MDG1344185.1 bifunctional phosphopantothenoylcysteine decarboxylase/phosphopantothenate--cysteine ligase CoaBC [Flavobacteriaceae bacterium]MDG1792236.1 bifunctional phosphopantothenoylcysteine decarboxylase/phosphopantothenate--c